MAKRLTILATIALFALFFFELHIAEYTSEEKLVNIEPGKGVFEMSNKLRDNGVIGSVIVFNTYVFLSGKRGDLKAGSYLFDSSATTHDVVEKIYRGDVYARTITIIEGWNLNDIATYLKEEGFGKKEEFYSITGRPPYYKEGELFEGYPASVEVRGRDDVTMEGFLFPDTYHIPFNADMGDVVSIILKESRERMKDLSFETVTIASLIEKEVRLMEDKKLVSGIIRERMRIGMPLQIDATITYLTGKRTTRVTTEETRIDSPYNTYLYAGLPKGPISSPGESSIEAAKKPKESEYLYYLSKPTGETVFSRNLEEHNIAKNEYLR